MFTSGACSFLYVFFFIYSMHRRIVSILTAITVSGYIFLAANATSISVNELLLYVFFLSQRLLHVICILLVQSVFGIRIRRRYGVTSFVKLITLNSVFLILIESLLSWVFNSSVTEFIQLIFVDIFLLFCVSTVSVFLENIKSPIEYQTFITIWMSILLPPIALSILLAITCGQFCF